MTRYVAILSKERRSSYGVDFPDLPGCVAAGRSLEEAHRKAAEALSLHLEGMLEHGEEIPAPRSLDKVLADPENRDGVAFLVEIPDPKPRTVRVNITLPEDVLERIDAQAAKMKKSRSAFLAEAALERIEGR